MDSDALQNYQYYRQRRLDQLNQFCKQRLNGINELTLEIGCGHGHFLTAYAEAHSQEFCLGIDRISKRIRKANEKVDKRALKNILFIKADSSEFFSVLPISVKIPKLFLLFLDPWPKKRHLKKRIIQQDFLNKLSQRMPSKSQLFFRTDHCDYWKWTLGHLETNPYWHESNHSWPFEQETYFQKIMGDYQSLIATRNEMESSKSLQNGIL